MGIDVLTLALARKGGGSGGDANYIKMPYEWVETAQGDRIAEGASLTGKLITDLNGAKDVVSATVNTLSALGNLFRCIENMFYPNMTPSVGYKTIAQKVCNETKKLKENGFISSSTSMNYYVYCNYANEKNDMSKWHTYLIVYNTSNNTIAISDVANISRNIIISLEDGAITKNAVALYDATFTQDYKAAEAKAVGSALSTINATISELPTKDYVTSAINKALGGIENGTY